MTSHSVYQRSAAFQQGRSRQVDLACDGHHDMPVTRFSDVNTDVRHRID